MRGMSPWLAAFLGAAIVGVAWSLAGGGAETRQDDGIASGVPPIVLDHGDQRAVLARLDGIERRLDALGKAVNAEPVRAAEGPLLQGRAPGAAAPASEGSSAQGDAAALAVSDEALERVVERLEKKKQDQRFARMSDEQMIAEARRLRDRERDLNGAREVLEHLLTRDLDGEERARALMDLGAVHRGTGEYERSESRLREAMRLAGEDSEVGVQAGYQLIWTYSQAKEPARGLAMADHLLQAAPTSPTSRGMRPWIRWAAARMALDSGDKARARTEFRALLEDFKDSKQHAQIKADATRILKELE